MGGQVESPQVTCSGLFHRWAVLRCFFLHRGMALQHVTIIFLIPSLSLRIISMPLAVMVICLAVNCLRLLAWPRQNIFPSGGALL